MLTNTGVDLNPDHFAPEEEPMPADYDGEWVIRAGESTDLPERFLKHGILNEARYVKPPLMPEIPEKYLCYDKAEELAGTIDIHTGSRHYAILNGTFIFGDFIEALLVCKQWQVKAMTISTLSMSENNIDSLANLIEGEFILELNLIVSDYFFSHERYGLVPYLYQKLDVDNKFQLAVAGTHCKICMFETTCGKFVVIHGSANLRSSANIEQIMIEENEELYAFNQQVHSKIIDRFKTINKQVLLDIDVAKSVNLPPPIPAIKEIKPLRHSQLWHQVAQVTNP